jgi:hypothetical protein
MCLLERLRDGTPNDMTAKLGDRGDIIVIHRKTR